MGAFATIDGKYIRPLYAASYLRIENEEAAFIEANSGSTVPALLEALRDHGMRPEQVRLFLVTHAHLDHIGGASALMKACPNATLYAHPRATRHLIDPARLVASAMEVYGREKFLELYGEVSPIPASRVKELEDGATVALGKAVFQVWHTPGHAKHHFVIHDFARNSVFTGDTLGLVYPRLQRGGRFAIASTSPIDFDGEAALKSIEKILSLKTSTVIPTHFGAYADGDVIGSQIRGWIEYALALTERSKRAGPPDLKAWFKEELRAELQRHADRNSTRLEPGDWEHLALDLELNAQGLAFAATRPPKARG